MTELSLGTCPNLVELELLGPALQTLDLKCAPQVHPLHTPCTVVELRPWNPVLRTLDPDERIACGRGTLKGASTVLSLCGGTHQLDEA